MFPETLESRKLFSAVTASQNPSGILTIAGTAGNDIISVSETTLPAENPFQLPEGTPVLFVAYDSDGSGEANALLVDPKTNNPFFTGVRRLRIVGKAGD